MTLSPAEPPTPPGVMTLPEDSCYYCHTKDGPLSPGKPVPLGPGVEQETAICLGCIAERGIDQ